MINAIRSLIGAFFLVTLLFFVSNVQANHIPVPSGYVNDFVGVLTSQQKTTLEDSLREYEQKTTHEIAVAVVKSLQGGEIDDFTIRAFEEWRIGKRGKDNGLLFLAVIDDRQMRIEVGYGLEPYLTDGEAGEIIRNVVAPEFKKGNYYQGISDGVEKIKSHIEETSSGESSLGNFRNWISIYDQFIQPFALNAFGVMMITLFLLVPFLRGILPANLQNSLIGGILKNKNLALFGLLILLGLALLADPFFVLFRIVGPYVIQFVIFALLVGVVYFASFLGRTSHFWFGGVLGGALGAILGFILGNIIDAVAWFIILGVVGLLLDFILSANYRITKQEGQPTSFIRTFGGLYSGKGGFGGFGGGRSGGGGASGRW